MSIDRALRILSLSLPLACIQIAGAQIADAQSLVYQESFQAASSPAAGGSDPVRVRWCLDGARIDHAAPGDFATGALRMDGASIDPLLHVFVGEAGCHTVRLRYRYVQLEHADARLEFAQSNTPRPNCIISTPWHAASMDRVGSSGGEVDVSIALDSHQGAYFRFDHGSNQNALWIDDLTIEVSGCPSVHPIEESCTRQLRGLELLFDTPLEEGVRPAGIAEWSDASIAPHELCGNELAGVLSFGQSARAPYATTHCIDTTGLSSAHLSIAFTKPLGLHGPSIEASIQGGPFAEIWRAEAYPVLPDQNGRCFWDALDLGQAGLLMDNSLRLRLVGAAGVEGLAFDRIALTAGAPPTAHVLRGLPQIMEPGSNRRKLVLVSHGTPLLGQTMSFHVRGLAPGTSRPLLGASLARAELPMNGGVLLIDPFPGMLVLIDDMALTGNGTEALWPSGNQNLVPSLQAFAGRSLYLQALATDTATSALSFSNGLEVIFGAGR